MQSSRGRFSPFLWRFWGIVAWAGLGPMSARRRVRNRLYAYTRDLKPKVRVPRRVNSAGAGGYRCGA